MTTTEKQYGDIRMVQSMTIARKLGRHRNGYSYVYVKQVLAGIRRNESISALHNELIALRTQTKAKA